MPASPTAPLTPVEASGLSREWAEFVEEMGRAGVPVRRTTGAGAVPVAVATLKTSRQATTTLDQFGRLVAQAAARAELGWADLATYEQATQGTVMGLGPAPYQAVVLLHSSLERLAEAFPQMTLRDAVGWAMAYPPPPRWVVREDLVAAVQGWHDAGIGPDGWVFAAAGLEPAETAAALASRQVTRASALVVAALRGAALPVTA